MTRTVTVRHGPEPASGRLGLVQDLLNTRSVCCGSRWPDPLSDLRTGWATAAAEAPPALWQDETAFQPSKEV
ncbi:UNVERIFIED_CONTAM: hypothetical protein RKD50_000293 [Streptomyces canus]|jgi:hypothetical protein